MSPVWVRLGKIRLKLIMFHHINVGIKQIMIHNYDIV